MATKPKATSALKDKLQRGEVATLINPDHPSASLTEFVARLGFDAIFIDCEHGMATIERVQDMCRAARIAGAEPIVRPDGCVPWLITRYLDAGAGGIMAPHIDTPEAARELVQTVRYARPHDFQEKLVIAMIESKDAIDRLPSILAVEGIDVFFVGPGDLSQSLGMAGQMHHPRVKALVKSAAKTIRQAGRVAGTLVVRDTAAEFVQAGVTFLYEHANNMLAEGARDFNARLRSGG